MHFQILAEALALFSISAEASYLDLTRRTQLHRSTLISPKTENQPT